MAANRGVLGGEQGLRELGIRAIILDQDVWVKDWRIHPGGLQNSDISLTD